MLDRPNGEDILAAVSRLLRETLMPRLPPDVVFQARVAANALDLVAREINSGERVEGEARLRLQQLLNRDGSLQELETELSTRIRTGQLGLQSPVLMEHLWATTLAKMAIDQPGYAAYRREHQTRAAHQQDQPKTKE